MTEPRIITRDDKQGRSWRRLICAIVGTAGKNKPGGTQFTPDIQYMARTVGRWAAEAGFTVLTGGMQGVMRLAIESAREAGALTMTILPTEHHHQGVAPAEIILPSGIGFARNYLTALACDMMIALPGGQGTLQEMSFARDFDRTVISWGGWGGPGSTALPFEYYELTQGELVRQCIMEFRPRTTIGPETEA